MSVFSVTNHLREYEARDELWETVYSFYLPSRINSHEGLHSLEVTEQQSWTIVSILTASSPAQRTQVIPKQLSQKHKAIQETGQFFRTDFMSKIKSKQVPCLEEKLTSGRFSLWDLQTFASEFHSLHANKHNLNA